MKVLGLDLGSKTLGVAISDPHGMLARGVENYRFEQDAYIKALDRTLMWIEKEHVDIVVLGYPKNMDGTIGAQGKISEQFKAMLEEKTACPIILWDERLTSKMASARMIHNNMRTKKRKKTIDQEAAIIILQSYLDVKK